MDAIEKAVRNALDKGDTEDKNYRRRVYVSARHALEKSMAGLNLKQEMVDERFTRLAEVAAMIESEFSPATEAFEYPANARRSYEAPAPSVDAGSTHPGKLTGEGGQDAARDAQISTAPLQTDEDRVPAEERQTAQGPGDAQPPEDAAESEKPQKPSKSAKKSRVSKRIVLEPAIASVETVAPDVPDPDLFGDTHPAVDGHAAQPGDLGEAQSIESAASLDPQLPLTRDFASGADADPLENVPAAEMPMEPQEGSSIQEIQQNQILDGAGAAISRTLDTQQTVTSIEPEPAADQLQDAAAEPHYEVRPVAAAEEKTPEIAVAMRREPKRGLAFLFILATLLAFLIMGLWIAYTTGTLKIRGDETPQSDSALSVDPQDQPDIAAAPSKPAPAAAAPANDWMMIFRPDNPGDLVVDPTIKAVLTGAGPLARLRIEPAKSATGDATVVFSIGQGILEQIAGKTAIFDIVSAADDGNPTQISVLCDFAGLGDCGRKRYQVDAATSDNLFQIEFPAGKPVGDGEIILNPDVDGKGRALEVYAIKVRIAS